MDLIKQLIQSKKKESQLSLQDLIQELIKYDKLSKSDKFKHITESPILQKQMPIVWSAFNNNQEAFYLLLESASIIQELLDYRFVLYDDIDNHYTKKEKTQLKIIGNVKKHEFIYHSLISLPKDMKYEECFFITEDCDTKIKIAVINEQKHETNIYQGTILKNEIVMEDTIDIKPFIFTKDEYQIEIKTYSIQGNNDYEYAVLNNGKQIIHVSMPNNDTFNYRHKDKNYVIKISAQDENLLKFKASNLNVNCEMILKYLPSDFVK